MIFELLRDIAETAIRVFVVTSMLNVGLTLSRRGSSSICATGTS